MSSGQGLTVRELANESSLGLNLLTARTALDRTIEGVHHSDLNDPTPWMGKGSVLITHGAAFADSPKEAVPYLDRIAEKGTVGLVIGIGPYLDRVDETLLEHAEALNIAVFEAPLDVSFRRIFAYVYGALTSSDMHRMRRALAVHEQLLDLLLDEKGMGEMLERLSAIIEMPLVLFDPTGKVVASAGEKDLAGLSTQTIWSVYASSEGDLGPLGVLEAEHGRVYAREVAVHGVTERVLAAVARQPPISEFADMALAFAQRVIGLDLLKHREAAFERRRMRTALLYDFLASDDYPPEIGQRLLEQAVDLSRRWRVAFFQPVVPEVAHDGDVARFFKIMNDVALLLEQLLSSRGLPTLSSVKGEGVVCLLVMGDGDLESDRAHIAQVLLDVEERVPSLLLRAGVSRPVTGLHSGASALTDALESTQLAIEGAGVSEGMVLSDDAGGRFRLVEGQTPAALRALTDRLITPLIDNDARLHTALLETVRVYLDCRLSPQQAAGRLYVHRNTLLKRLRRVEALLGIDFDNIDDVLELYVALRASQLLSTAGSWRRSTTSA